MKYTLKISNHCLLLLAGIQATGLIPLYAQSLIASQDFEITPVTPELIFNYSGGVYYTGNSDAGDRPASVNFFTDGSRAYGVSSGSCSLSSAADIDLSNYNDISVSMKIASFSVGSFLNGADAGDHVLVEISTDGGSSWSQELKITGNSNAFWYYSNTSASVTFDGDNSPTVFAPAGGGNRTSDGYSMLQINSISTSSQVRLRITLLNNSINELWVLDAIELEGTWSPPLPVTLLSFSGEIQQNEVFLEWTTAMELNNDHFSVERSADGLSFLEIAQLPGMKNSNILHYYSYTEEIQIPNGKLFYRLRQTDRDGSFTFSGIICITPLPCKETFSVQLFQNPFEDRIRLELMLHDQAEMSIVLYEPGGRIVSRAIIHCEQGVNIYEKEIDLLQQGIFLLQMRKENEMITLKVLKR